MVVVYKYKNMVVLGGLIRWVTLQHYFGHNTTERFPTPAVWHTTLLNVQWIKSSWWREELSETCGFSWQNKFVKLVHIVDFITKKFVLIYRLKQRRTNYRRQFTRAKNLFRWRLIFWGPLFRLCFVLSTLRLELWGEA